MQPRIKPEIYRALQTLAAADNRSAANYINLVLKAHLDEHQKA